ncbi:hypothetical protein ACO1KT_14900, partial [Staphylococcus aureus]
QAQSEAWLKTPNAQPLKSASSKKAPEQDSTPFAEFFDPEFIASLTQQATESSTAFIEGIGAYIASDYTPPERSYDVLWQRGST